MQTGDRKGPDGKTNMVEELELWRRDPVECVKDLMGNPAFRDHMSYVPEEVFADSEGTSRIYDKMWTGEWWWKMQVSATASVDQSLRAGVNHIC